MQTWGGYVQAKKCNCLKMSKISKDLLDSIPPFLTVDVPLWFCLFESAMLVHKIDTEDLKFHILICSLPPKVSHTVFWYLKCFWILENDELIQYYFRWHKFKAVIAVVCPNLLTYIS